MPVRSDRQVLVVAKAPVAGRVKTRLQPTFSAEEAAGLAEAALVDTLAAAGACRAGRRIVALDGDPGPWLPHGFEVVPQVEGPFAERLAAAWAATDGPCIQVGMDTPQVTAAQLDHGLDLLSEPGVDAVLGLAEDGGWWGLGLRRPHPGAFEGVPMSTGQTGARQAERLHALGLRVRLLPPLRDMDRPADVSAIAEAHPHLRVSRLARSLAPAARR